MRFFKRSSVRAAVKPPSFVQIFVEAHQYIFHDFKRLVRALYPVLILFLVCSVAVTFSGNGFSYVGWMIVPWVVVYTYLMLLITRDVINGRQPDFTDVLNQRHLADVRCFFFFLKLSIFSILPFSLILFVVTAAISFDWPVLSVEWTVFTLLFVWLPVMLALFLCVLMTRWALVVPAAYDGVKLALKKTKSISANMPIHILILSAISVLYMAFESLLMVGSFSDILASVNIDIEDGGKSAFVTFPNPRISLDIFVKAAFAFLWSVYFLIVFCFISSRIYQWGSQNPG